MDKIITDEQVKLFLKELSELSRKHHIYIDGCGCCGSPYLVAFEGYAFEDDNDYENLCGNDEDGYRVGFVKF